MRNQITSCVIVALVVVFCATLSKAQWTPDPFCPFPFPDHPTRYPYYGNCSVYWECWDGTKYVMDCPEGLEFNAPLQQCDAPEIAHCNPFAPTTENPSPPPTYTAGSTVSHGPEPNCPFPSDDLFYFPYDGDCTLYWECYEGEAYLYNCPSGLWWHQAISECDYPGTYCDGSGTQPTNPDHPTTGGDQPTCRPGEGPSYYPYPGDCTLYYECVDGTLYLNGCPGGLWWFQNEQRCDSPGPGAVCDTVTSTTRPTPPIGICDDEGISYWPNPYDCHSFIECQDGIAYDLECPPGLYYSASRQACVGEELSECCQAQGC